MASSPPGDLLRLPHDILVGIFGRLHARNLGSLATTCQLLQYSQSSLQAPNPVEDALRLRAGLNGWSRTLPVDSRRAVDYLLRLAWQDVLEFRCMFAARERPLSLFVDSCGSLRSCGVELQHDEDTETFLDNYHAAPPGSLGFGRDWHLDSDSAYLRMEEPTPVHRCLRLKACACGAWRLARSISSP